MGTFSEVFCSKAIATVKYLIYRYCDDPLIRRYVYTLHMQFTLQCCTFGRDNLDIIKRQNWSAESDKFVQSSEDLENFVFESLRFDERDKRSISR
jgi:hypothetical protein